MHRHLGWLFIFTLMLSPTSFAGQPIFSEMPRWSGGWGIQAVQEYRYKTEVGQAGSVDTESHILNIDAVYTWKRWIRVTAKAPLVLHAAREGQETERGLGPFTLALPLKQYFNLDGRSGSWTFAPQLRTPSLSKLVMDNPWQHGWGFGYETETYQWLFGLSTTLWGNFQDQRFEQDTHIHLGTNLQGFGSSGHLKLAAGVITRGALKQTIYKVGPTFYWRISDLWHLQTEWRHRRYWDGGLSENRIRFGLAVVY